MSAGSSAQDQCAQRRDSKRDANVPTRHRYTSSPLVKRIVRHKLRYLTRLCWGYQDRTRARTGRGTRQRNGHQGDHGAGRARQHSHQDPAALREARDLTRVVAGCHRVYLCCSCRRWAASPSTPWLPCYRPAPPCGLWWRWGVFLLHSVVPAFSMPLTAGRAGAILASTGW